MRRNYFCRRDFFDGLLNVTIARCNCFAVGNQRRIFFIKLGGGKRSRKFCYAKTNCICARAQTRFGRRENKFAAGDYSQTRANCDLDFTRQLGGGA